MCTLSIFCLTTPEPLSSARGTTRLETLRRLGIRGRVLPMTKVDDGINAVRLLLPRCWFDEKRCAQGLEACGCISANGTRRRRTSAQGPLHDWTSHGADAFRYLAMGSARRREGRFSHARKKQLGILWSGDMEITCRVLCDDELDAVYERLRSERILWAMYPEFQEIPLDKWRELQAGATLLLGVFVDGEMGRRFLPCAHSAA